MGVCFSLSVYALVQLNVNLGRRDCTLAYILSAPYAYLLYLWYSCLLVLITVLFLSLSLQPNSLDSLAERLCESFHLCSIGCLVNVLVS